ncbi:MAG: glycosyltransferase [Betaproteobacteria bacterium]|nr:glycosyltransferase [Betaproteobacteria bacterium]
MLSRAPRLSLVVPVYNGEHLLPDFLRSVAAQTLPAGEFEIIAVDDGSTDGSPAILKKYSGEMPGLRVVRQENGGLSEARNTGMREARGEWLAFADADDFVAPATYARWLAGAEQGRVDMLLGNGLYHYEGREPDRPILRDASATQVVSGADWLRARLEARFLPHMVWLHLYRREFVETNRLCFVPHLIHEDVLWTTRALLRAQRVQFDPEPCYYYRLPVRRPSPGELARQMDRMIPSTIYNARQLAAIVQNEVDAADLAKRLGWQLVDGALSVMHLIERHPEQAARRAYYRRLCEEQFFGLLWRHAFDARQKKKIAGRWLRARLRSLTS